MSSIKKLSEQKVWVLWKREEVNGKPTKVPYQPSRRKASTVDKSTWSTYEEVKKHRDKFDGIGFVFDGSMLGIDLDHVLEKGKERSDVTEFIKACNTYTEYSPSGTGVHVLFNLTEPFTPSANKHTNVDGTVFECYTKARYFTHTEKPYTESEIRSIDAQEAAELLTILGYPWKSDITTPSAPMVRLTLSDEQIIDKMFSGSNGSKIKTLWNGDTSEHNSDESSADMALCMHLTFWCANDFERIERLWLSSPLGQREKTQSRKDYRETTIRKAIEKTSDVYSEAPPMRGGISHMAGAVVSPLQLQDPELIDIQLQRTKGGTPHNNLVNAMVALSKHPTYAKTLRFNTFQNKMEFNGRELQDVDFIEAQHFLQDQIGLSNISFATAKSALIQHAYRNKYDEALDWLNTLEWDGVPRLEHWLIHSCRVEPTLYHRAIGAQWLLGMVNRLVNPGAIFDHVLTMYGAQGIGKTSFFRIIGGKWYKAHTETVDGKDFYMKLQGACLIDLDEGATMFKSDSIKIKSIITETCDEFRAPWGTVTQKFPRRFVFSMSTNDPEPLKDQTGNRRYWILRVENKINFKWLEDNRTQLFAEAYHAIKNKIEYPAVPVDVARSMQEEATEKDEWINTITAWVAANFPDYVVGSENFSITTSQIFEGALEGGDIAKLDRRNQMRISSILTNELHLHRLRVQHENTRQYRYFFTKYGLEKRREEYKKEKETDI